MQDLPIVHALEVRRRPERFDKAGLNASPKLQVEGASKTKGNHRQQLMALHCA